MQTPSRHSSQRLPLPLRELLIAHNPRVSRMLLLKITKTNILSSSSILSISPSFAQLKLFNSQTQLKNSTPLVVKFLAAQLIANTHIWLMYRDQEQKEVLERIFKFNFWLILIKTFQEIMVFLLMLVFLWEVLLLLMANRFSVMLPSMISQLEEMLMK